ncbi:hypothetical protein ACFLUA_00895 [Chloroflexota bacterium]
MCFIIVGTLHSIYAQSNTQTATPDEEKDLLTRTTTLNGYSADELEPPFLLHARCTHGAVAVQIGYHSMEIIDRMDVF